MKILRKYVLPHLEQLCKEFLQSIIINNARDIKMSSLEIKDKKRGIDLAESVHQSKQITVLDQE